MARKRQSSRTLTYVILGLALLIVAGIFAYYSYDPLKEVDVPVTTATQDLYTTQLPNGLTVTVKELEHSPLVTIQFWVRVGARNEPQDKLGISHIFEHIWFKGTPTQPVGSFHKRVESLGGELNAMTSLDWTMYFVTVPKDKFNDIFPYMVDLLLNPMFNETEIEKELQVITEEQRFSFNDPLRYIDDQFAQLLIENHPYRNPIIGTKETILNATKQSISEYYKTWYSPNNMNIVIVGNIPPEKAVSDVTTAFGNFQSQKLPEIKNQEQTPLDKQKYNSSTKDIGYTYVATGYFAPNAKNPDRYAMTVLNSILINGDNSRVDRIIKQEKQLIASGVGAYVPLIDAGVMQNILTVEPEKAGQAKAELLYQINRFKTEDVTDEELERAKALLVTQRLREQEELFQIGYAIGQAWVQDDLGIYTNYIDNINKVTKQDVRKVANKYLNNYAMYELKPKI
jgi:zinc protease